MRKIILVLLFSITMNITDAHSFEFDVLKERVIRLERQAEDSNDYIRKQEFEKTLIGSRESKIYELEQKIKELEKVVYETAFYMHLLRKGKRIDNIK